MVFVVVPALSRDLDQAGAAQRRLRPRLKAGAIGEEGFVIPSKDGISLNKRRTRLPEVPAFAGMTTGAFAPAARPRGHKVNKTLTN